MSVADGEVINVNMVYCVYPAAVLRIITFRVDDVTCTTAFLTLSVTSVFASDVMVRMSSMLTSVDAPFFISNDF